MSFIHKALKKKEKENIPAGAGDTNKQHIPNREFNRKIFLAVAILILAMITIEVVKRFIPEKEQKIKIILDETTAQGEWGKDDIPPYPDEQLDEPNAPTPEAITKKEHKPKEKKTPVKKENPFLPEEYEKAFELYRIGDYSGALSIVNEIPVKKLPADQKKEIDILKEKLKNHKVEGTMVEMPFFKIKKKTGVFQRKPSGSDAFSTISNDAEIEMGDEIHSRGNGNLVLYSDYAEIMIFPDGKIRLDDLQLKRSGISSDFSLHITFLAGRIYVKSKKVFNRLYIKTPRGTIRGSRGILSARLESSDTPALNVIVAMGQMRLNDDMMESPVTISSGQEITVLYNESSPEQGAANKSDLENLLKFR